MASDLSMLFSPIIGSRSVTTTPSSSFSGHHGGLNESSPFRSPLFGSIDADAFGLSSNNVLGAGTKVRLPPMTTKRPASASPTLSKSIDNTTTTTTTSMKAVDLVRRRRREQQNTMMLAPTERQQYLLAAGNNNNSSRKNNSQYEDADWMIQLGEKIRKQTGITKLERKQARFVPRWEDIDTEQRRLQSEILIQEFINREQKKNFEEVQKRKKQLQLRETLRLMKRSSKYNNENDNSNDDDDMKNNNKKNKDGDQMEFLSKLASLWVQIDHQNSGKLWKNNATRAVHDIFMVLLMMDSVEECTELVCDLSFLRLKLDVVGVKELIQEVSALGKYLESFKKMKSNPKIQAVIGLLKFYEQKLSSPSSNLNSNPDTTNIGKHLLVVALAPSTSSSKDSSYDEASSPSQTPPTTTTTTTTTPSLQPIIDLAKDRYSWFLDLLHNAENLTFSMNLSRYLHMTSDHSINTFINTPEILSNYDLFSKHKQQPDPIYPPIVSLTPFIQEFEAADINGVMEALPPELLPKVDGLKKMWKAIAHLRLELVYHCNEPDDPQQVMEAVRSTAEALMEMQSLAETQLARFCLKVRPRQIGEREDNFIEELTTHLSVAGAAAPSHVIQIERLHEEYCVCVVAPAVMEAVSPVAKTMTDMTPSFKTSKGIAENILHQASDPTSLLYKVEKLIGGNGTGVEHWRDPCLIMYCPLASDLEKKLLRELVIPVMTRKFALRRVKLKVLNSGNTTDLRQSSFCLCDEDVDCAFVVAILDGDSKDEVFAKSLRQCYAGNALVFMRRASVNSRELVGKSSMENTKKVAIRELDPNSIDEPMQLLYICTNIFKWSWKLVSESFGYKFKKGFDSSAIVSSSPSSMTTPQMYSWDVGNVPDAPALQSGFVERMKKTAKLHHDEPMAQIVEKSLSHFKARRQHAEIYQDNVWVLWGDESCGKTTLISVIAADTHKELTPTLSKVVYFFKNPWHRDGDFCRFLCGQLEAPSVHGVYSDVEAALLHLIAVRGKPKAIQHCFIVADGLDDYESLSIARICSFPKLRSFVTLLIGVTEAQATVMEAHIPYQIMSSIQVKPLNRCEHGYLIKNFLGYRPSAPLQQAIRDKHDSGSPLFLRLLCETLKLPSIKEPDEAEIAKKKQEEEERQQLEIAKNNALNIFRRRGTMFQATPSPELLVTGPTELETAVRSFGDSVEQVVVGEDGFVDRVVRYFDERTFKIVLQCLLLSPRGYCTDIEICGMLEMEMMEAASVSSSPTPKIKMKRTSSAFFNALAATALDIDDDYDITTGSTHHDHHDHGDGDHDHHHDHQQTPATPGKHSHDEEEEDEFDDDDEEEEEDDDEKTFTCPWKAWKFIEDSLQWMLRWEKVDGATLVCIPESEFKRCLQKKLGMEFVTPDSTGLWGKYKAQMMVQVERDCRCLRDLLKICVDLPDTEATKIAKEWLDAETMLGKTNEFTEACKYLEKCGPLTGSVVIANMRSSLEAAAQISLVTDARQLRRLCHQYTINVPCADVEMAKSWLDAEAKLASLSDYEQLKKAVHRCSRLTGSAAREQAVKMLVALERISEEKNLRVLSDLLLLCPNVTGHEACEKARRALAAERTLNHETEVEKIRQLLVDCKGFDGSVVVDRAERLLFLERMLTYTADESVEELRDILDEIGKRLTCSEVLDKARERRAFYDSGGSPLVLRFDDVPLDEADEKAGGEGEGRGL